MPLFGALKDSLPLKSYSNYLDFHQIKPCFFFFKCFSLFYQQQLKCIHSVVHVVGFIVSAVVHHARPGFKML